MNQKTIQVSPETHKKMMTLCPKGKTFDNFLHELLIEEERYT